MEQTNEKRKILRTAAECAAAFAAAALFVLCMAVMLGFAPFGENTVNYKDGVIQYLDFFAYYKRLLSGEASLLYTFEKTLGGGNIAVFSYYLASPFNLLAVFFTQEQIPALFTVLTLCKAATAAATFTLYLRIRFPRMKPVPAVCLALCYALGQYTFSQASNTMWLDGIYMLPLILLGTYRLVQNRRKKLLLILSVAASILFNWYSAGINCMFCILYYIYEDASENRFGGIKAYIGRALPFIGCLALGVLLSACLFLPTLLALRGGRAGFDVLDIIALLGNYVENMFTAVTNFRVGGTSEQGSVSLYCGYFALIGMGAYFFTQAEKGRKRNASAVFLLFTVLLFYVSVFIFAFSLFKSGSKVAAEDIKNPKEFMFDMYMGGAILHATNHVGITTLEYLFTDEELAQLAKCSTMRRYILTGPSERFLENILDTSRPLLRNVIETADRAIAKGDEQATLRFAHDVNLIPFIALMGIREGSYVSDDYASVPANWLASRVSPMGTNVQLIFFRNKKGDILVKVLFCEREQVLDEKAGAPVNGVYYRWTDLKKYLESKL